MSEEIQPASLGRVVHVKGNDGVVRAAIIVKAWEPKLVSILVLPTSVADNDGRTGVIEGVRHSSIVAEADSVQWFWPPRV